VTHRGTNRLVPIGREGEEPVLEKPIIGDQVVDEKGKTVGAENVDAFAKKVVEQAKSIAPVPTKTDSLNAPKKLTLTIPLASDHLRRRAEAFLPAVEKYSRMYSVDPAYILATIHTESHFNPMARSHCNAMGLMQLMAKSGGREACREVYGKDVIPPPATLFNPEKNIMLGTAYISILLKRYYGEVANDSSRIYCAVSAYNTGAGNVAKALVGVPKLKRSRDRINTLPHDEVLRILLSELPYVETRAYLRKVLDRMPLYR